MNKFFKIFNIKVWWILVFLVKFIWIEDVFFLLDVDVFLRVSLCVGFKRFIGVYFVFRIVVYIWYIRIVKENVLCVFGNLFIIL